MPDQLKLCNLALRQIHQLPITDITASADASAEVLLEVWDDTLAEFLSEAFWNWAKTRTTLTAESPAPDFEWANRFALPDDFVSVVGLNEIYVDSPSDLWEIESGYLFTDENVSSDPDQVYLEYISKPTASNLDTFLERMDPKAVPAFVTLLASKIAPQLMQDGLNNSTALIQRYYQVDLPKARARNGNQMRGAPTFPSQTSTNRAVRGGGWNPWSR